ncbi:hypothetical protein SAMD00023353_2200430 [Rosellinia necatrix]|uniref:Uncharacterized protein n=1 Tax=Rosellinia necatrix TaxID=77044 RepID=A0A1S8A7Q2_ROSNE|nr:hypothetical protein SAMD00023353_2200430 [Rosellinia necatrix]
MSHSRVRRAGSRVSAVAAAEVRVRGMLRWLARAVEESRDSSVTRHAPSAANV